MTLMERVKHLVRRRRSFAEQTARLEFGVVDNELVVDENGVQRDELRDPEAHASACPECQLPVAGDVVMGEDGTTWHQACKLHRMLGCLGNTADATNCAVCGKALTGV
jgi:hypothetical protein